MKIIEFIFLFIRHFAKVDPERIEELKGKAGLWITEQKEQQTKKGKFIEKSEMWYWQVTLAVLAPVFIKMFANWQTQTPERELDIEDVDFE